MRQLTVIGITFIFFLTLLAALMVPEVVQGSLTVMFRAVAYGTVGAVVVIVGYGVWSGIERLLMLRAQRRHAEHDARIKVIEAPADHRVWTHELATGQYRNLSLDSRVAVLPGEGRQPTDEEMRTWLWYHQSLHAPRVVGGQQAPLLEGGETPVDVLSIFRNRGNYLIVGAMDAGKTTLLRWLATERMRLGWNVAIIDPHSPPGKWPAGCHVIGTGRDFDTIGLALKRLLELMDYRYKMVGGGTVPENAHPGITVIIDEYMPLYENIEGISKTLVALLTESRKVNIEFAVGSHSRRVRSLGLDGRGDLLEGLAVIHLRRHMDGRRDAIVEIQNEKMPAVLPGAFEVLPPSAGDGNGDLQALDRAPEPDDLELRVLALTAAGKSMKEISQAVWGPDKFGGFYNEKIRDILDRWEGWEPGRS